MAKKTWPMREAEFTSLLMIHFFDQAQKNQATKQPTNSKPKKQNNLKAPKTENTKKLKPKKDC